MSKNYCSKKEMFSLPFSFFRINLTISKAAFNLNLPTGHAISFINSIGCSLFKVYTRFFCYCQHKSCSVTYKKIRPSIYAHTQLTFTFSKSKIETLKKALKYVQS